MDVTLLILAFFLLLTRYLAFLVTVPLFGAPTVPVQWKLVLGAFLAYATLAAAPVDLPLRLAGYGMGPAGVDWRFLGMIMSETAVGLLLSLAVTSLFAAFQLAGFLQGFQMGFTIANVVDPLSQEQASIFGQFLFFIGTLVFLALDGHHVLLRGLVESARVLPPGTLALTGPSTELFVRLMQAIFLAALQFALPVVGTLFVIDIGLGVMARSVPQMNVFMVGLPLKAGVGLLIMALSFGGTSIVMELFLKDALVQWLQLIPLLRG